MNTILQKRIEEAANITVQNLYDYAKQTRNPEVSKYDEGYLDAIDVQGDFLFREGANYALSNQWISVEEALPEYKEPIIVKKGTEYAFASFQNGNFYIVGNIGKIEDVTHWMLIPTINNEEK